MGSKLVKSEPLNSPVLQYVKESNEVGRNSTPITHLEHNNHLRNVWKKRFLKTYTYNLCDPRSPGPELNRTPLVVEDDSDKNFNLDDTFADLFTESNTKGNLKTVLQSVQEAECFAASNSKQSNGSNDDKIPIIPTPSQTKIELISQQNIDPRSPSIGVERTPITLNIDNDYDDTMEDAMLENILSTLSFNMTNSASITSDTTTNSINANEELVNLSNNRTKSPKTVIGSVNKDLKLQHSFSRRDIYEDHKNASTEIKNKIVVENSHNGRTPLSSVHNRPSPRPRSRSMEPYKTQNCTSISLFKSTKENMSALNVTQNS